MDITEKNLAKLQKLFAIMDNEALTREEFVNAFEKVADLVLKIEKKNTEAIEKLESIYSAMWENMAKEHKTAAADMRTDIKEELTAGLQRLTGKVNEKLSQIKNGKDGKDADETEIVENVLAQIQPPDISAIQGLREELDELKRRPARLGGGGFSYIALLQHIVDDETPSGTVNGVNKDFTVANTPNPSGSLKVFRGGARQRITEDYTLSGRTITFTVAPVSGEIILCDYMK